MWFVYLAFAIDVPVAAFVPLIGIAKLTGAAFAIMTPGLIQCAYLRRWP